MPPPSSKSQSSTPSSLRPSKEPWRVKRPASPGDRRSPLIIHMAPATIIYAKPQEFMGLVQRLTGKPSTVDEASAAGCASTPAACSQMFSSVPDINIAYEADQDDDSSFYL